MSTQDTVPLDRLVGNLLGSVPGIAGAVVASSDGLLLSSVGLARDQAERHAAAGISLLALGHAMGGTTGRGSCEQILLRYTRGHLVCMRIQAPAALIVEAEPGANLGAVATAMTQFVTSVGPVFAPELRGGRESG
ncbi:roadblock/LC7 domain-containing protein [Actinomadura rayongensis]|uniref:Roadblock/LC7 domain-containing protein n=1 Tax=Actinomadura rayongensis TaxID=1429076 RepID=A0A6I4WI30_9ACTN|nr:roadblock/LC7 domain-containing protein [Actinomadura rayongensis]